MKAHLTKSTDNTGIENKILLRKLCVEDLEEVNVLDLFAGENKIWANIETKKYYGIEMQKGKGKNLHADNLKVIPSLDLSKFNVIDCDSYGIPYRQIEEIYKNPTLQKGTKIIYTSISSPLSGISKKCLIENNLYEMYKKNKVLLNKLALPLFYEMLRKQGVKKVTEYEIKDSYIKKYGFFTV